MRHTFRFISQFIRSPGSIGAIAPSSARLSKRMVDWVDWSEIKTVVELGPGTGVFTKAILEQMQPDTHYIGVELDASLFAVLQTQFPQASIFNDSAENIRQICDREGMKSVDLIVSGLPWAAFDHDLQERLLLGIQSVISPKGKFSTFAYLHGLPLPAGKRFATKLTKNFTSIEKSRTVWRNLPPALVYYCSK